MLKNKILAILGPTNTGKTFSAMERLFSHRNGVIGFPLRLLARENYEFAKKKIGEEKVALITGEEKKIPGNAKYFFCTVESMPDDIVFDFVAIDEVQLASDYERGHLFTDKIIGKVGRFETVFLGSNGIEKILKKIHPAIKVLKKPRLSKLSYCGYKNLARLPKRSAVIAFSQIDVYEIANKIKQAHGGVSIIMGALSPDVRNAQVKLFEDGKVDHMVATDAIGLGLNLNIKNIFFSNLAKFDGIRERILTYDEISQIAGRAGRFLNNGFFGTTGNLKNFNEDLVKYIENCKFSEIKKIFWRNSNLDFSTSTALLKSLTIRPRKNFFFLKKNAKDHNYLKILLNDKNLKVHSEKRIRKLWEICGIPDYSGKLDEFHSSFLKKIFLFLIEKKNKIPNHWIDNELKKINKDSNKISELNYKISQIRTWSFISFKINWLEKNHLYQHQVRKIEYELSAKLHKELISQFIGEFKNLELINDRNHSKNKLVVKSNDNSIKFGSETIGEVDGLRFKIFSLFQKSHNKFNNRFLKHNLNEICKKEIEVFLMSDLDRFHFEVDGGVFWDGKLVGKFGKSENLTNPRVKIFADHYFMKYEEKIRKKIDVFFSYLSKKELSFISDEKEIKKTSQSFRAIKFSLYENLGHCMRNDMFEHYKKLNRSEISHLKKLGFKIGNLFFYFEKKGLCFFKQMLINIFFANEFKSFLSREVFKLKKKKISKSKLKIFEKMGFYLFEIKYKEKFLVHYEYYEKFIRKIYYFKKNENLTYKVKNEFEKMILNNHTKVKLVTDY